MPKSDLEMAKGIQKEDEWQTDGGQLTVLGLWRGWLWVASRLPDDRCSDPFSVTEDRLTNGKLVF